VNSNFQKKSEIDLINKQRFSNKKFQINKTKITKSHVLLVVMHE